MDSTSLTNTVSKGTLDDPFASRRSVPFMRLAPLIALLLLNVTATACDRVQARERAPTMAATPFDSVFRLADTLTPEQPDSVPIGLVSGIDFAPDGGFVITDVRSVRVMRYAPDGRLLGRMGRFGFGPGEFQMPMFPVIDDQGRIHVLDLQVPRITVFNADGSFLRTVSTIHLGNRVGDLEVLPGGDYLLVAWHGPTRDLLFRTDSLGKVRASYVPHAQLNPEGEPARPIWGNMRNASLSVAGDKAFVITALSDSLWTVNLRNGNTSAQRITPPTYITPTPPRGDLSADGAFSRWANTWTTAILVRGSDRNLMAIFVRGILMRGDSAVAAYRGPDGKWQGLTTMPIVLTVRGDTAVTLLDPDAETVRFGVHARR
jgi:hypothetical protein